MKKKAQPKSPGGPVSDFIQHHFRHFNAATLMDAARGYAAHLEGGGQMMICLAGAMSTAELGLSLAEMIRRDKVHLITCTGANLEEDVFNLVAHDYYERVPHYRHLTPRQEEDLLKRHLNRVTDTCIPEGEAMRRMEEGMLEVWVAAEKAGKRHFPHEFFYQVLRSGKYEKHYQIDPKDSWMLAAAEKDLPIVVPGWEDSTLGNMYAAALIRGDLKNTHTVRTGIEYMTWLADFYARTTKKIRLACSRLVEALPATFRFVLCPCCTRIWDAPGCRCGVTSVKSVIRRRATAVIQAPCRTKKSRGANWGWTRPVLLSNPTRPSSPR
jgi:deoxyhypusine synthase